MKMSRERVEREERGWGKRIEREKKVRTTVFFFAFSLRVCLFVCYIS